MGPFALLAVALAGPAEVPWATPRSGEHLRLAVVGSLPAESSVLAAAVSAVSPDLLVFTGVSRKDELAGWPTEGGVLALSAGVPNRAYLARFPGIGGDPSRPAPYGTLDLTVGETRWRIVVLTTSGRPLVQWEEQGYWLPRALDRSAYDRLIVLADGPRHTLTGADPEPGARGLLDQVQDIADPMSFALWIAGNSASNEVFTPGGAYGELHLAAGASGGESSWFAREGRVLPGVLGRERQQEAWDAALTAWSGPGAEVPTPVGFWTIDLTGGDLTLTFHRQTAAGFTESFTLARDRRGWRAPHP